MATLVDTDSSAENLQERPVAPSSFVKRTWEIYGDLTDRERQKEIITEGNEIAQIVNDFGKDLVDSTYEAAFLAPIMEKLVSTDPEESERARQILAEYRSKNPQDREYVRALSADLRKINSFLNHSWDKAVEIFPEPSDQDVEPVNRQYKNPWNRHFKTIPLRDILSLVSETESEVVSNPEGVNIESILIAAAAAYNTLRNAGRVPEDELLQTIYDIDSFYRPLLEVIGYDAFVMALKRESTLIRMSRNGGEYDGATNDTLKQARKMISELPPANDIAGTVDALLTKLFLKESESKSVLKDSSGHGMQFGAGRVADLDIDELEDSLPPEAISLIRYVWRVKTDTEIARKITRITEKAKAAGKEPPELKTVSDLLGVTVIVPSIESLSYEFRIAAGRTIDSNNILPTTSSSRTTPFHAKGKDVIQAVSIDFGEIGELDVPNDNDPDKPNKNGHKVAKITLQYQTRESTPPISFEIQFQTDDDRTAARIGPAAHAFKTEGYNVADNDLKVLSLLNNLHKRRMITNTPGLTQLSKEASKELFGKPKSPKTTHAMAAAAKLADETR